MLKGIPASFGLAIGRTMILAKEEPIITDISIDDKRTEKEVLRFEKAVEKAKSEISSVREKVSREIGETQAKIFDAHKILLEDPILIDETVKFIRKEKKTAEYAFKSISDRLISNFASIKDNYVNERITDIHDIIGRVIQHLSASEYKNIKDIAEPTIIVAHDISPSEVVQMHKNKILGFITNTGGRNSHAAIIARALGIPAVVGTIKATEVIKAGDFVALDGILGEVIFTLDEKTKEKFNRRLLHYKEIKKELLSLRDLPAETIDGKKIEIAANAELPVEISSIAEHGGCTIGLFRTEYLFLNRKTPPTEEEQFKAYKEIVETAGQNNVVVRTIDLGGDKDIPWLSIGNEKNPSLGWRAIRICLEKPVLFETQLRAILRASVFGKMKIMFPMISSIDELRSIQRIFNKAKNDLITNNMKFDNNIQTGIMIETPGAALMADKLAGNVDFFSIGTNDLIQFTLAVDRSNERVVHFYDQLHPSVLKLIKMSIEAAHNHNIWVSVCGEMGSNPLSIILLLGMGIDQLSVSPVSILEVKRFIRSITYEDAKACAANALKMNTSVEIEAYLNKRFYLQLKEIKLMSAGGLV